MKRLLFLLVAYAMLSLSVRSCFAEECQEFLTVIDSADSGFEDVRGAFDVDTEFYTSTVMLPGADNCSIVDDLGYFECVWNFKPDNLNGVKAGLADLIDSAKKCLGASSIKSIYIAAGEKFGESDVTRIRLKDGPRIVIHYHLSINKHLFGTARYRKYILSLVVYPS